LAKKSSNGLALQNLLTWIHSNNKKEKRTMMNTFKKISLAITMGVLVTGTAFAGNPDRSGQAGANQLLVNPWGGSSGMGGANMASISGVEAMSLNAAGIMNVRNNEFDVSHAIWLGNLGVSINSFGFCTRIGKDKDNALGLSITSFDFGNVPLTTENQPQNTGQTYTISMINLGINYAHRFSDNITAGAVVRAVTEGVPSVSASGISLDAGIQYAAGTSDRYHFGVSLRNVGPAIKYAGSGLSMRGVLDGSSYSATLDKRAQDFELPSVLSIAGAYDIIIPDSANKNTLSANLSFLSNAFSKDQFALGLEFSLGGFLKLRAGLVYEDGIFSPTTTGSAFAGPCGGATVDIPFGKDRADRAKAKRFALDYSYRMAAQFGGTHTFGLRLNL
jgi:hypothetical protein